ncbi:hypothetical protein B0H17DRAFT_1194397 [Mycena rosella]|uniref:Uncharacterized protein n=1 Tax=Mycena rosella TaxID=1033263 RepID=A0AAD7GQF6_MYCRO|nr:hypothetical protein B0H17DRAFT_1194397 [Mycena rosella]
MCQYDTTGVQYACGHYQVTSLDRKHDCGSKYCVKSRNHPRECRSFSCIQHYGPDLTQTTSISTAYCAPCQQAFFSNLPTRGRR